MNINIEFCSGCLACMNACPKDAISVKEDENGFIIPDIDADKCVNCGICEKVCDFQKSKVVKSNILRACSFVVKNKNTLYNSTSGGAFSVLSDLILDKGGVVVGAMMESDFMVRHVVATTKEERDRMRGSKYVQSDIGFVFREIKKYLQEERYVMFVGTPCQTAGLLSFLGTDSQENLLVVDFLCHGVPNNRFFKEHIKYLQSRRKKRIVGYTFRSKIFGWYPSSTEGIVYEDHKFSFARDVQSYCSFFYSNVSLRASCMNCKYRSYYRYSDITIADFWQIEHITGKTNNTGVSFVLSHNEKGSVYIDQANKVADVNDFSVEKILFRIATTPAVSKFDTKKFWELFHTKGYEGVVAKYVDHSMKRKIRFLLKKVIRRVFR